MTKFLQSARIELLPTEILYGIVKCLYSWEIKRLCCVSRRIRDVCLPSLFRKITCKFSKEGFDKLQALLQSNLRQHVVSFEYVVPKLLKPELLDYATFKAQILTPEDYVEECECWDCVADWDELEEMDYPQNYHPSYTTVYRTLRKICAEQRRIIETGRDSALLSLALQQLPKLTELSVVFWDTMEKEDWVESYLSLGMTMNKKSYEHHIQLVSAALNSAKERNVLIHTVKLVGLSLYDSRSLVPDIQSLTTLLTELLEHIPNLQFLRSRSAIEALSHAKLNIRQLDLCSFCVGRGTLENFLRTNAKSILSLGVHDITVTGQNRFEYINLSPAYTCNMFDIPVKKASEFSCPCLLQGGWKLTLAHNHHFSAPKATKRKSCAS